MFGLQDSNTLLVINKFLVCCCLYRAQTGAKWLRIVLTIHAAHLMANPSLVELLAPVIGLVESRLSLLPALSRLSGRLELLASQLDGASVSDENASPLDMQSCLLMYQDAGEEI